MATLQLKSTNPDLSWVIVKNPESGMLIKSLRKGKLFSWFSDSNTYNVYFKDAQNEVSYKDNMYSDFEYMDVSRYNSPAFVINTFTELFNTTLKEQQEKDVAGFKNSIEIGMMLIKNIKYIEIFDKYFDDYSVEVEEIAPKNYRVKISTENSVRQLLHFVNLFIILNILKNDQYQYYIDESQIAKYISTLEHIDANYFIRYVFKVNFIRSEKKLKEFRHILENSSKYKINFEFGDTATQRRKFLQSVITYENDIVDIGCGEGRYGLKFAEKLKNGHQYIGIDIDKECRRAVYWKSKKKQLSNVKIYKTFDRYMKHYEDNRIQQETFLLVEVIEHMEMSEVYRLLVAIRNELTINGRAIITTPNKDFNKFYNFEESEFRHDDHKFELSSDRFRKLIGDYFYPKYFNLEFHDIGDNVDGITPTQGVVITRK